MRVQLTQQNLIERDARVWLSRSLITRPASTFMINLDEYGLLIVDREAVPNVGSMMLMASEKGYYLQRATCPGVPAKNMWGVVMWHIRRP